MATVDVDAAEAGGRRRHAWAWAEIAAVSALAAAIAAAAVARDLRRPFEADEILTYDAARAAGPAELYRVLSSGGFDASPPLYVLAAWQAHRLVGDPHLAYRLPATAGFVAMCICLYAFARRRVPPVYAAIAMLVPPLSPAFFFASFARPYGLMLGLCGLALLCWQAAADGGRWRPPALAGLAASLAAGVATHYYTVLLLAPLGLAELVRTLGDRRGRPDPAAWAALACAFAPLPFLRPLMDHSREIQRGASWLSVQFGALLWTYGEHLPPLWPLLLAFGVLLLISRATARGGPSPGLPYPPREVALILGLLMLPALGYALGVAVTKAYVSRYVAPFLMGVALMLSYLACALFRGAKAPGAVLAGVLLAGFLASARRGPGGQDYRDLRREIASYASRAAAAGRRLVIPLGDDYTVYLHYADPTTADRMTLVELGDEKHRRLYEDLDRWRASKGLAPFATIGEREFLENIDQYYIYGEINRIRGALGDAPLTIELLGGTGGGRPGHEFFGVVRPRRGPG